MCEDSNGKKKEEENGMATLGITNCYTINRREAELIANTPKTTVKKPSYVNKFHLSPEERQKRALDVLNKWKYL